MKKDERLFLLEIAQAGGPVAIRKTIERLDTEGVLHHKRAWYLLEKWCEKNWYSYGVRLDLGWLTEVGKAKAKELAAA